MGSGHQVVPSVELHRSAMLDVDRLTIGESAVIGPGVRIRADSVDIAPGVQVGKNVHIDARHVVIGHGSVIEEESRFEAIGGQMDALAIGDFAFVGHAQRVMVPELRVGDYTALHNSCLISGYDACSLGHNCWVGQESILNSTAALTCGNNVRIGTRSQLWTHVSSGERLEGCTMFGAHPLVLEDNVWIVGGAVVSPNLVVANSTIVLVGSVLTRSTEAYHCYAGVPARDITDRVEPYRPLDAEGRFNMMAGFIDEFHEATDGRFRCRVHLARSFDDYPHGDDEATSQIVIGLEGVPPDLGPAVSTFSLGTKTYRKRRSDLEQQFIRFHLGNRARFIPLVDDHTGGGAP